MEEEERRPDGDARRRQREQGGLELGPDRSLLPPRFPNGRREDALRRREQGGIESSGDGFDADRAGLDDVRGQRREGTPGEREPERRVERASEELEIVGDDNERAEDDERREQPRPRDAGVDADGRCRRDRDDGESPERSLGDLRAQRPAAELVQRVRTDAERERKGEKGGTAARPRERRRE